MNRLLLGLILLSSLVLGVGCARQTHEVMYEVGGTAASIALSYRNGSNALEQIDTAAPWQMQFEAQSYQRVVVNARNKTNGGSVSCRITVDGQVVSEGESAGAFKVVRCEGFLTPPTPTPAP